MTTEGDGLPVTSAWSDVAADPNGRHVRDMQSRWSIERRHPAGLVSWKDELVARAADRAVLDIGFVEHDTGYMAADDWEHGLVARVAETCLGIDILEQEVRVAADAGYDVVAVDATSGVDLGRRFDLVVIGDVIEHVHSPQRLLEFAGRHVRPDGRVLVKTPNPHYAGWFARSFSRTGVLANADHVAWFTPDTIRELATRSGLEVVWFAGAREPSNRPMLHWLKQRRWLLPTVQALWQSLVVCLAPSATAERSTTGADGRAVGG